MQTPIGTPTTEAASRAAPARPQRSLAWRVFWRGLPWTGPVVAVYLTQIVTSVLMGGEWNTALVALQAIVVALFVAVFYALALAKEKEILDS